MQALTGSIGFFFGWLLKICCSLTGNFGWAVWVFTALTKVIMLPVSVVVQKNSIKMVKMYPEMNRYKAMYRGDKDMISEAQYSLYKREKYHPILDLIPVIIQLILLMGVVEGIRSLINEGYQMAWLGLDLSQVPLISGGKIIVIPILAAASALIMCATQNMSNVLQSEQSKANKYITLTISVGLSLYLGLFVAGGIGLYWIASNFFSIALMYILNAWINPKKYVDYEELEKSKKLLADLKEEELKNRKKRSKEEVTKERVDYKRFMKYEGKQIVFYSEGKGFYKYFKDIIEDIIKRTDIVIHYISSDFSDDIYDLESDQFRTYYIGENKLIVLMMKMDADLVVMTTPDLQRFHIKRSIVRKDIEYVYIDHGIGSMNMLFRKHAIDNYDTILASNRFAVAEVRAMEKKYGLKEKKIVEYGFCLIDNMISSFENDIRHQPAINNHSNPSILIAPSYQPDNILDLCIDNILDKLLGKGFRVVVRPHPQYIRHNDLKVKELGSSYSKYPDFELQTDFSSNMTVYDADILMTDWSGIAYEYSLTTLKPVLFINTPMKVLNPDYEEIGVTPLDIEIRDMIGIAVDPADISDKLLDSVEKLLHDELFSPEQIKKLREEYLFNVGHSAKVGADYLINSLISRQ